MNTPTHGQLTAAPRTVRIGKREFVMRPLKDVDYGEFELWVQDEFMRTARRNLDGLKDSERESLLKHAYDTAARITITSPEALHVMTSLRGGTKLVWMALRHDNDGLTQSELFDFLNDDPEALAEAMEEWMLTNPQSSGKVKDDKAAVRRPDEKKRRRKLRKVSRSS